MLEIEEIALAISYNTQLVSVLFGMRDSDGFPRFPSVFSFSVSLIFADTLSIRDPIACVSLQYDSHSYHPLFFHLLDRNLLFFSLPQPLLYRSEYNISM